MHKFFYDPIGPKEDKQELLWHNLKQADKFYKLDVFIGASMAWFKQNPTKNYSDLEKALRVHELNTHLYAKKVKLQPNQELRFQNSEKPCKYQCIFSCKPKHQAIEEVLKNTLSYEDNLEKLKEAGVICLKDEENVKEVENAVELNDNEKSRMEQLKNLEVKIRVEEITAVDIIEDINNQIEKRYNREADVMVIGQTDKGDPMFAFTIENKLVSDVGFIKRKDNLDLPEYEIIQLALTDPKEEN